MKPFHHKVVVEVGNVQTRSHIYNGMVVDFGCHVENLRYGDKVAFDRNQAHWIKDNVYIIDCCDILYTVD